MLTEDINDLKKVLEDKINQNSSYDEIYETSVKIDKLLVKYYEQEEKVRSARKGLNY